jgi:hypothetical protein
MPLLFTIIKPDVAKSGTGLHTPRCTVHHIKEQGFYANIAIDSVSNAGHFTASFGQMAPARLARQTGSG